MRSWIILARPPTHGEIGDYCSILAYFAPRLGQTLSVEETSELIGVLPLKIASGIYHIEIPCEVKQ